MIRLYGHLAGSFRTVSIGLREGFEAHGVLSGCLMGAGIGFEPEVGVVDTPIAVIAGDPNRVLHTHTQGLHKRRWLMLAPNSEGIPGAFVESLGGTTISFKDGDRVPFLDGFLAPSEWAKGVLERCFPNHPVVLCPHGISQTFKVNEAVRGRVRAAFEDGVFRVLHITSTHLGRKCTRELLLAWKEFVKDHKGYLDVLVNPYRTQEFKDFVKANAVPNVNIGEGQGFKEVELVSGISGYHLVAQPSRAEGFGLLPLEARAAGVPVLATACTGHAQHMHGPGIVVVPHGELARSDDYWGAKAPTVLVSDILEQLKYAYANWRELDKAAAENAENIRQEWSWEKQTAAAVKRLQEEV